MPLPPSPLSPRARRCLARTIALLDPHTDAPLRLVGHSSTRRHEVFEMCEEFELGRDGRRFLVSVGSGARDALLVPVGSGEG